MRTLFAGYPAWGGGLFSTEPVERTNYLTFLEAYLRALQPHLEQKGWLQDAVFYMVDEPWSAEAVQANVDLAALLDRAAPRLKRLMTAPRDRKLWGLAQIWVPGGLPDAHPEDKTQAAQCEFLRGHGAEPWWYICCGPLHPYPNFFVDYPTIDSRMVFWLTWKYAKTGFLYWGVEYYGNPKEMTPDGPSEHYALGPANMGNGDGVLCYYGPDQTLYPSIRLNAIRDGIEDYEYFPEPFGPGATPLGARKPPTPTARSHTCTSPAAGSNTYTAGRLASLQARADRNIERFGLID